MNEKQRKRWLLQQEIKANYTLICKLDLHLKQLRKVAMSNGKIIITAIQKKRSS